MSQGIKVTHWYNSFYVACITQNSWLRTIETNSVWTQQKMNLLKGYQIAQRSVEKQENWAQKMTRISESSLHK